jgi:hypothetical protein
MIQKIVGVQIGGKCGGRAFRLRIQWRHQQTRCRLVVLQPLRDQQVPPHQPNQTDRVYESQKTLRWLFHPAPLSSDTDVLQATIQCCLYWDNGTKNLQQVKKESAFRSVGCMKRMGASQRTGFDLLVAVTLLTREVVKEVFYKKMDQFVRSRFRQNVYPNSTRYMSTPSALGP